MKTTNKIARIAAGAACLAGMLTEESHAEEKKPFLNSFYVNAAYKSQYIGQRGFTSSETPVIQGDLGFSLGKLSYDLWANYTIKKDSITEIDNCFSIPFDTKNYRVTLSAIEFTMPKSTSPDALETGITIARKNLPFDASVFAGQIYGESSGWGQIANCALGKTFKLSEKVNLSLQGKIWYNQGYYVKDKQSGFSHASLSSTLNINAGHGITLSPMLTLQKRIESFGGTFKDQVVYGFSINKNF